MVTWSVIMVCYHCSVDSESIWAGRDLKEIAAFMFYNFIDGLLKTHSILPVIYSVTDLTEEPKQSNNYY